MAGLQNPLLLLQVWLQLLQRDVRLSEACAVGEEKESVVLRFLRANQFSSAKTIEALEGDIAWRRKNDVIKLRCLKPKEILG